MESKILSQKDTGSTELNPLENLIKDINKRNHNYLEAYSKVPYGISKLRFWEIEACFVCPVAGLCITAAEEKRLLKKAGSWSQGRSDFESHEMIVQSAKNENPLSRCVDYMLSIKYGKKAEMLYKLEERRFMAFVKENFHPANYALIIFAAATKQDLSVSCRQQVFGMVHIALFDGTGLIAEQEKTIEQLQCRHLQQAKKYKQAVQSLRNVQKENDSLSATIDKNISELNGAQNEILKLNEVVAALNKNETIIELEKQNQYLREEVNLKMRSVDISHKEINSLKAENRKLLDGLKKQKEFQRQFVNTTNEIIAGFVNKSECDEACPSFNLCRKRIFVVGGIARMAPLYRALIEKMGGIFEYHDGCVKGGVKTIEQRLKRADCVLCPVNCNSHGACSLVKNIGKKYNKPVHMLPNFSLSAVQKAVSMDQ